MATRMAERGKVCDKDVRVTISRREQWMHFWVRWGIIWTLAFGACIGTIAFIASYIQAAMGGDSDSDILSNAAMSSALEGENIMCNVCGNCPGCILDQNEASMPIVFYTTGPPLPPPAFPPSPSPVS